MATTEQLTDQLDEPRLGQAFALPGHADEVELDVRASLDDRQVVVEERVRIGVTDDDASGIDSLLLEDGELREPDIREHAVCGDREPGPNGGAGGCTVDALFGRAHPRFVRADLADDPGANARLPHPGLDLGDQLMREIVYGPAVDPSLRRVVGRPVPAAAHHYVETSGRRDITKPQRVTPDARKCEVDEATSAGRAIASELLDDDGLVAGQLPVVPARLDMPQRDLGVLVRQREPKRVGVDRTEDGLDVRHGPRCYAVATGSGVRASRNSTMAVARRSRSAGRYVSPASMRWSTSPSSSARKARVTASTSSDAGSSPLMTPCRRSSCRAPANRSRRAASISLTPGSRSASAHAWTR